MTTLQQQSWLLLLLLFSPPAPALRCYTDLKATKSLSVNCGDNAGCVKIFKKSEAFDEDMLFIPLNQRNPEVTLFRGCFLVKTHDTCYSSTSTRLTYCWCNKDDLCNSSLPTGATRASSLLPCLLLLLASSL